MSTKVSVIVPIYNAEKTLCRCVESILDQSYKHLEIILVNDGSTDSSLQICEDFARSDSRVIIINKKKAGVSAARNSGLHVATAEFIQFVDADDTLKKNMTKTLVATMLESNSDVVICGYDKINNKKTEKKYPKGCFVNDIMSFKNAFVELYKNVFFNAPWNKLYRRSKITTLFDEDLAMGEDLLFNLSYFSICDKISIISDSLYRYSVSSANSLAKAYSDNLLDTQIMLHKKVREFFKDNFNSEDFSEINEVFAKEIYYYLKKLIILSEYDRPIVQEKISACLNCEDVQKMLNNVELTDSQLKIACQLMRMKASCLLYLFFKFKNLIMKNGLR